MKYIVGAVLAAAVAGRHPMESKPQHVLTAKNEKGMSLRLEKRSVLNAKRLRSASTK